MTLPVVRSAPAPDPEGATAIDQALRMVPPASSWPASYRAMGDRFELLVNAPDLAAADVADVWFFPEHFGVLDHAAAQSVRYTDEGLLLTAARDPGAGAPPPEVVGVLVYRRANGLEAVHIRAPRAAPGDI